MLLLKYALFCGYYVHIITTAPYLEICTRQYNRLILFMNHNVNNTYIDTMCLSHIHKLYVLKDWGLIFDVSRLLFSLKYNVPPTCTGIGIY